MLFCALRGECGRNLRKEAINDVNRRGLSKNRAFVEIRGDIEMGRILLYENLM